MFISTARCYSDMVTKWLKANKVKGPWDLSYKIYQVKDYVVKDVPGPDVKIKTIYVQYIHDEWRFAVGKLAYNYKWDYYYKLKKCYESGGPEACWQILRYPRFDQEIAKGITLEYNGLKKPKSEYIIPAIAEDIDFKDSFSYFKINPKEFKKHGKGYGIYIKVPGKDGNFFEIWTEILNKEKPPSQPSKWLIDFRTSLFKKMKIATAELTDAATFKCDTAAKLIHDHDQAARHGTIEQFDNGKWVQDPREYLLANWIRMWLGKGSIYESSGYKMTQSFEREWKKAIQYLTTVKINELHPDIKQNIEPIFAGNKLTSNVVAEHMVKLWFGVEIKDIKERAKWDHTNCVKFIEAMNELWKSPSGGGDDEIIETPIKKAIEKIQELFESNPLKWYNSRYKWGDTQPIINYIDHNLKVELLGLVGGIIMVGLTFCIMGVVAPILWYKYYSTKK